MEVNVLEFARRLKEIGADCRCGNVSTETVLLVLNEVIKMPQPFRLPSTCVYVTCYEPGVYECDKCGSRFCSDHGSAGGDRQVQDVGPVAYPSSCWKCGGYNADE